MTSLHLNNQIFCNIVNQIGCNKIIYKTNKSIIVNYKSITVHMEKNGSKVQEFNEFHSRSP